MQRTSKVGPIPALLGAGALALLCGCSTAPQHGQRNPAIHEPTYLADPAEPLNRGIWVVNRMAILGVVDPVSKTYRGVVPEPVRESVTHVGANLLYPGRLINEGLQGRWQDAGNDSLRFLTNSTIGIGGIFDVASRWNIPKPRADFSQTFQKWGWKPETYIMLPLLGPSDQSSATARIFNEAADPLNYIDSIRPLNITLSGHRLTERNDSVVRLIQREPDPYSFAHLAWSYLGLHAEIDWSLHDAPDVPSLETLGAGLIRFENPRFPDSLRTEAVMIPSTEKRLPFTYRMQEYPAPLVFIVPGLGSHRLSDIPTVLAEHLHRSGYSVATISSTFHPEFMERASTAVMPGHLRQDVDDLWQAMAQVNHFLERKYEGRTTKRAVVGASLGGYMALQLASMMPENPGLKIDRFVGLNVPVDLSHAAAVIDHFQQAPDRWPSSTRQKWIDNTLHKLAAFTFLPPGSVQQPAFSGVESQYLIGLNFRHTLRDALYSIEARHRIGLTSQPVSRWDRQNAYQELNRFNFSAYAYDVMIPHFLKQGIPKQDFTRVRTLREKAGFFAKHPDTRVITNANDLLLTPSDLQWLQSTFGKSRLSLLPSGGHLGNVGSAEIRRELVRHLKDLQ